MALKSKLTGTPPRVGLVIEADAVRAVEYAKGTSQIVHVGKVPLPNGVVREGEVLDVGRVAEALRELWKVAEIGDKAVALTIGGPHIVVRPVEVPALTVDEIRSTLQFQVGEHSALAPELAIVDYQDVSEPVDGKRNVLFVAAAQELCRKAVDACDQAGLQVRTVDVTGLLIARALAPLVRKAPTFAPNVMQAIVEFSGDHTNIVVTQGGTAIFARSLSGGIARGTAGIANDPADVEGRLRPLFDEVRSSVQFAAMQVRAAISNVIVVAPAANTPAVVEGLTFALGVPVHPVRAADLLAGFDGSCPFDLDSDFLAAVALGLPYDPARVAHAPNLLPREQVVRNAKRRDQVLVGVAVAAVAGVLTLLTMGRTAQVVLAKRDASSAQERAAKLQAEADTLKPVAVRAQALAARQAQIRGALTGAVDYPRLINEVATKLPEVAAASSFTASGGKVTVTVNAEGTAAPPDVLDTYQLPDSRLGDVWVQTISTQNGASGPTVTFALEGAITPAASTNRLSTYGVA